MQNSGCAAVDMMLTNSIPQLVAISDRFHELDSDNKWKNAWKVFPIIATCNPRERRRNEAVNSKKDLSGCARSERWFSLDWTPHRCPFLIYVRLTSLTFSNDICSSSTHFMEHTVVSILSAGFPSSDYFGAKLVEWFLYQLRLMQNECLLWDRECDKTLYIP